MDKIREIPKLDAWNTISFIEDHKEKDRKEIAELLSKEFMISSHFSGAIVNRYLDNQDEVLRNLFDSE